MTRGHLLPLHFFLFVENVNVCHLKLLLHTEKWLFYVMSIKL